MKCVVSHTIPEPDLHLFHSRDRMTAWCEKRGIPVDNIEFLSADAQTWVWMNGCELVAVVLLENMADDVSDVALIAHEAVHVALDTLDAIGEGDYGEETLAYLVQAFTRALLHSHRKWMSKRRKK